MGPTRISSLLPNAAGPPPNAGRIGKQGLGPSWGKKLFLILCGSLVRQNDVALMNVVTCDYYFGSSVSQMAHSSQLLSLLSKDDKQSGQLGFRCIQLQTYRLVYYIGVSDIGWGFHYVTRIRLADWSTSEGKFNMTSLTRQLLLLRRVTG